MTVQELIDRLTDMDPDAEVRLAIQPSWPFEHDLDDLVETGGDANPSFCEDHGTTFDRCGCEPEDVDPDAPRVVYLAEGGQRGYLSGAVSRALGWR